MGAGSAPKVKAYLCAHAHEWEASLLGGPWGRELRGEAFKRARAYIADAFGDPSLTLAYWLPERERYVDADGHQIEPPGA